MAHGKPYLQINIRVQNAFLKLQLDLETRILERFAAG
jgi:hypothetical protein